MRACFAIRNTDDRVQYTSIWRRGVVVTQTTGYGDNSQQKTMMICCSKTRRDTSNVPTIYCHGRDAITLAPLGWFREDVLRFHSLGNHFQILALGPCHEAVAEAEANARGPDRGSNGARDGDGARDSQETTVELADLEKGM